MKKSFDFSKIFDPDFLDMNKGPKVEIKPIIDFPDLVDDEYMKKKKTTKTKEKQKNKKANISEAIPITQNESISTIGNISTIDGEDLFMQDAVFNSEEKIQKIKSNHLISDKKSLKKAIILSEILQKPVSKRR